jgi:TldD protein
MTDGVTEVANTEIVQGVGLRVVIDGQIGYAFTEELSLPAMLAAARMAASIATVPNAELIVPSIYAIQETGNLYVTSIPWDEVGNDKKQTTLERINHRARAVDLTVSSVSATWFDVDERIMIATLDGRIITDHRPMIRVSTQVSATRFDEIQSGYASIGGRQDIASITDVRIDQLVADAVDRTLILFDAHQPEPAELPVILAAGRGGILLHEAIGHSLEADFNLKGTSIYSDMLGMPIAEPVVTIVDEGTVRNERGALNYDDEGNACGRNTLVENGVLRSYLHDSVTAESYDVDVTGSGRRESFMHAPMPRMTCTSIENGPHRKDEIIAAVDYGIIAETITNGSVAIGAGDFSFYVKNGWLVEGGKITAPLRDMTLTGNGPKMLQRISMVANDKAFDPGGWTCGKNGQQVPVSQGIPTTMVSRMSVGKGAGS